MKNLFLLHRSGLELTMGGASSLFGLQANGSDSDYSTRHSRIPLFAMADSVISSAQSRKNSKAAAFRELSSAVTVE
jgi:hypothetical protein